MPEDITTDNTIPGLQRRVVELEKVNKMYREELCNLRVMKGLVRQMIRENKSGQISIRTLGKIDSLVEVG